MYYDYRYTPNSGGPVSFWFSEPYDAVNAANLVIGQIDNLPEGAGKNNILGQALAARAFAHFDLVRVYGKIPTQSSDANSSLGIVYVKVEDGDVGDPLAQPARETVASNYTEIIGDLERASTLIGASNGEGRLNKNAVFGILSRVYLYNGEWQKAIDAANQVTTPLATAAQLPGVYTDANNAGIVFELAINTTSESGYENVGVLYNQTVSGNIRSEYVIDFGFWNSIEEADQRRAVLQTVGTYESKNYNAIIKFRGETGQVNGRVDIKVVRAAEVLLNKAEAQFNLGLEDEALISLNQLRDLRYSSYLGGETGQELEDAIQFERRVELAFEGHRFFDIKRRGEAVTRTNAGDIIDGTGTPPDVVVLPAGDHRFQFPIPIGEINANPNFVQNPGY